MIKKSFPLFVPLFHGSPAVSVSPLQKPLYMNPIYLSFFRSPPLENTKKTSFKCRYTRYLFYTEIPSFVRHLRRESVVCLRFRLGSIVGISHVFSSFIVFDIFRKLLFIRI